MERIKLTEEKVKEFKNLTLEEQEKFIKLNMGEILEKCEKPIKWWTEENEISIVSKKLFGIKNEYIMSFKGAIENNKCTPRMLTTFLVEHGLLTFNGIAEVKENSLFNEYEFLGNKITDMMIEFGNSTLTVSTR